MPKSLCLTLLSAATVCTAATIAQGATELSGNTIVTGRLKISVVEEIQDRVKRTGSCPNVDSITIAPLSGKTGNQFNSQGDLRIGSMQERWTANFCGTTAAFIVELTGNGMLGPSFTVRPE